MLYKVQNNRRCHQTAHICKIVVQIGIKQLFSCQWHYKPFVAEQDSIKDLFSCNAEKEILTHSANGKKILFYSEINLWGEMFDIYCSHFNIAIYRVSTKVEGR